MVTSVEAESAENPQRVRAADRDRSRERGRERDRDRERERDLQGFKVAWTLDGRRLMGQGTCPLHEAQVALKLANHFCEPPFSVSSSPHLGKPDG